MQEEPVIKMTAKVGKAGRLFIPAPIRRKINIKEGQELEIRLLKMGSTWMLVLQEMEDG